LDASTPEGKIIATLKHELRARGFHYRDIAARLRVSEATIKRYFSGKGVSLPVLSKLADLVDLDLFSLAELAQRQGAGTILFSKQQEAALAKNWFLSFIYFLLWHGWMPNKIRAEFGISTELERALDKLEALGLIRCLSNEVKILATPDTEYRNEQSCAYAQMILSEINLHDPNTDWTPYAVRLGAASAARLHEIMAEFIEDARGLMMADLDFPPEQVQWYRLLICAQPVSRKRLLRLR
jgi:transcriptional regulator with XRE-family HTH domain